MGSAGDVVQPRAIATREGILETARSLFDSTGFDHTSVEQICDHAFISRGAFYYHFASKEDVLVALATERGHRIQEAFDSVIGSTMTTREVVGVMVRLFLGGMTVESRESLRSVVLEMIRSWTLEPPLPSGLRINLVALVRRAEDRNEVPDRWRPDDLVDAMFGCVLAAMLGGLATSDIRASQLETRMIRLIDRLLDQ